MELILENQLIGKNLKGRRRAFSRRSPAWMVKTLSEDMGATTAYDYSYVGYGLAAFVGVLIIVLFVMGPPHKDK